MSLDVSHCFRGLATFWKSARARPRANICSRCSPAHVEANLLKFTLSSPERKAKVTQRPVRRCRGRGRPAGGVPAARREHRIHEDNALPAVLRVPGRAAQIGLAVCPPGW